ncbi:hypothetical protein SJPD1_1016 [Sulfurospirillum diekertiae]|uniref:Uncharacterized protein n=1 Tax=Sulfurospirillum diekertiae TaxID=1854492 RepID=A0A290HN37_9BACT|nr:hypothetical protein SJPD1_1016 [Sulfurospirillum diekertiae]
MPIATLYTFRLKCQNCQFTSVHQGTGDVIVSYKCPSCNSDMVHTESEFLDFINPIERAKGAYTTIYNVIQYFKKN